MAVLKILKFGEEALRKTARPVEEITPRIKTLLDDMIETMRAAGGCGLAAPQVGVLRRIAVIEVEDGVVYELINPKIIAYAGEQRDREGCLSNPGEYGITKRPKAVTVRATDRNGKEYELTIVHIGGLRPFNKIYFEDDGLWGYGGEDERKYFPHTATPKLAQYMVIEVYEDRAVFYMRNAGTHELYHKNDKLKEYTVYYRK